MTWTWGLAGRFSALGFVSLSRTILQEMLLKALLKPRLTASTALASHPPNWLEWIYSLLEGDPELQGSSAGP